MKLNLFTNAISKLIRKFFLEKINYVILRYFNVAGVEKNQDAAFQIRMIIVYFIIFVFLI